MQRAIREIKRDILQAAPLLKVAAYCRVSTDSADQLHSYAAQIKEYTAIIGQNPLWILADIYADEGLSGLKTDKRDDLMRLIADCRKGKVNRVLVKSVSRFARNTYDSLTLTRLLKSLGVSVYFEEQDIDTAEMDDEFLLTMQSEAAQNESLTLSQNVRWSYKRRMEKGEFVGTVPAYGYKLAEDKRSLEIYEPEAEIVRRIFAMYLSGMGKQAIAKALNAEGVPRRYGYRTWYVHAVDYILNNERAVGDALLQKSFTTEFPFRSIRNKGQAAQFYVENNHPAIISRADFEAAQRLQQTRRRDGVYAAPKTVHPLRGKLICSDCGHTFRRMIINNTAYWECNAHVSGTADCQTIRYSEEAMCDAFTLLIHKLTANREGVLTSLISQLMPMPEIPQKVVRVIPAKTELTQTAVKTGPLRVAAYCRVSTKKDEQHLSFEAQREVYTDRIMTNPEWQLVDVYADRGLTGTVATKRPNFMRMIKDCRRGKIDLILTKSVMRFARNTLDALEHIRLLKSLGIGVIFETQGIDTRKMKNEFMLTIYASLAQAESENLSVNIAWGFHKSYKNGNVSLRYKSLLGYREGADGQPEIDPEQAATVRRIYAEFLAGHSLQTIADNLMADGVPTAKGGTEWRREVIQSILRSEKYIGDAILQKTFVEDCLTHKTKVNNGELPQYYVENNHPAIIDRGMWNRVQEELARRGGKRKVREKGVKTQQGKYSGKYALTELLVCGECGKPYRRCTWSKNGQKKVVWRCVSRLDFGKKYCADSPSIEESLLQDAILEALTEQAKIDPGILAALKEDIGIALTGDGDEDDPYTLGANIAALDAEIDALYERQKEDRQYDYDGQFERLYAQRNGLKEKLAQIKASAAHKSAEESRLHELFTVVDGIRNRPLDWSEPVIRKTVERVRVLGKDKISISFRMGSEVEMPLG
jgi:DNA invertase Pin-like site-specific DNA recombinase